MYSANPKQVYPRPVKRKYVHKDTSPEATARRRISSLRNWDVMQLTNIVGQLKKLEHNLHSAEMYKLKATTVYSSGTRAELSIARDFLARALANLKAHNKDPKNNPLP